MTSEKLHWQCAPLAKFFDKLTFFFAIRYSLFLSYFFSPCYVEEWALGAVRPRKQASTRRQAQAINGDPGPGQESRFTVGSLQEKGVGIVCDPRQNQAEEIPLSLSATSSSYSHYIPDAFGLLLFHPLISSQKRREEMRWDYHLEFCLLPSRVNSLKSYRYALRFCPSQSERATTQ